MTRKQVVHFTGVGPAWPASYIGFYSNSGATTPVTVYSDQIASTVLASGKTGSSPVRKLRADNLGAVPPPALGISLYVDSSVTTLYARPETITGVAVSGAAAVSVASYGPDGPITPVDPSQQGGSSGAVANVYDPASTTYGAKYDGTTDDSAAIQAAIDAAAAAGGGIVELRATNDPNNTVGHRIKINTTLRIKTGVWLRGLGPTTVLAGTANPMIALPTSGGIIDRATVSDLFLQSPAGAGIKYDESPLTGGYQLGWPRIVIENVTVADAVANAFELVTSGAIEARLKDCVSIRAGGIGFAIGSTDNVLIGCTAGGGSSHGFLIQGGNNRVSACKGYGNTGDGFWVAGAGRHNITGCEAQDNVLDGFEVSGTWNVISAVADSNGRNGFNIYGNNNSVNGAGMYGGGGSGQVTPIGFKVVGGTGNVVSGVSNCAKPVVLDPGNWANVNGSSAKAAIMAGGNGMIGKGYKVPSGSLDVWRAARDASSSQLTEVVGFGDSLTYGQVNTGSDYSWLSNRLREKSTGAGFADGGMGYAQHTATSPAYTPFGTEPSPVVSAKTGFALVDTFQLGYCMASSTSGDSITFSFKCGATPRVRLWFSRFNSGGRFAYSVNGAAGVTANTNSTDLPPKDASAGGGVWSPDYLLLTATDGLINGSNTITITNPANLTIHVNVEVINGVGIVWQNNATQGTDSYALFDVSDTTNNTSALALLGLEWGTTTNGITAGQPSELLGRMAASGAGAPYSRTLPRKPSLCILAFGTNDIQHADNLVGATPSTPTVVDGGVASGTGLSALTYYYKIARVMQTQFGSSNPGPYSAASAGTAITAGHQAIVTLPTVGAGGPTGPVIWNVYRSTSSGGTYQFVGQALGSSSYFIDNIVTPGANAGASNPPIVPVVDTSRTENALGLAIRLIRNAGADVLIVLPSIESLNNSRHLGAVYKNAVQRVADSFSVPWVDWDVALGPGAVARQTAGYGGGSSNPHLTPAAYQVQGDFLWNKVLSL